MVKVVCPRCDGAKTGFAIRRRLIRVDELLALCTRLRNQTEQIS